MPAQADQPLGLKAAMDLVRRSAGRKDVLSVGLGCGFTPLHLEAFVAGYVSAHSTSTRPRVVTGTYGDLAVALQDISAERTDGTIVFLDWPDLDPRLSARRASAPPAELGDLARTAEHRLGRLIPLISELARSQPVVVVPPTSEFPAYASTRLGQISAAEAVTRARLSSFLGSVSAIERVRLLSVGAADATTSDLRMLLKADFPLTVAHSSSLARDAVGLLLPAPAKKGLITDLDDTLWRGLVGEVGPQAVTWDLDSGSQHHAMYQQLLRRLSANGALVAVASKNEQPVVDEALGRRDIVVDVDKLFPVLASWRPKSHAVGEILKAWNIAAADVVFVDDNPLELAEIGRAYPEMTVLQFHPKDPAATLRLIRELDAMFARDGRSAEDDLRVASLRSGSEFTQAQDSGQDYVEFLRDADARLELNFSTTEQPQRAYELVQKTNQFNLNGRRHTLSEWQALTQRRNAVVVSVKYADRFGELGVISVLTGVLNGSRLTMDSWVLSCRAFSRAVEVHTLKALADHLGVVEVAVDYSATSRNQPVESFLISVGADLTEVPIVVSVERVAADFAAELHTITIVEPHLGVTALTGATGQ